MSEQIAVRLPDELAERLDRLVENGRFASKAEAVRSAIQDMLDHERRTEVGERIADGYRRIPQSDEEVAIATRSAIRSIEDEPW
jgi:Arc/MetJ-type ribon-helix-helix transcriptional regulator